MRRQGKGPVAHARHEHRGWHVRTCPDAALLSVMEVVTVAMVVGALVWLDALVLHALLAYLLWCSSLDGPRTGDRRTGGSGGGVPGEGRTSSGLSPALGPWEGAKGMARWSGQRREPRSRTWSRAALLLTDQAKEAR